MRVNIMDDNGELITSSNALPVSINGSLANVTGALPITKRPLHTLDTTLDWKYTTSPTTAYAMFVPEHDGTVWGRNASGGIYNLLDVADPATLTNTPVMDAIGEIIHIHPYKEDGNQKIAFVTRDTTNKVVRAYLADGMDDATPALILEYAEGVTDTLCCDSYYDGLVNVVLIGQYGTTTTPKNLWASFDGGRTYAVINQTTVAGVEMQSHWHAVHYDRFSGRIWASEGDGPNSAINWSDDLGVTWDRDTTIQPTLIKSFADCVVFGHDEGFEKAGLSIWYRNNLDNRDILTLNRVLTINDTPSYYFYPTARMWAQRGDLAYILFIRTDGVEDVEYIYGTNDGGNTWTGASVTKRSVSRIDQMSGITKQGYIVGRLSATSNPNRLVNKIVYAKVADNNEILNGDLVVTLANAESITDTVDHIYYLTNALSEYQIRKIKEIKISIFNTHTNATTNATATISLLTSNRAISNTTATLTSGLLYTESPAMADGASSLVLSALAGGIGASAGYKVIPALRGLHSNLILKVKFANAPTSGSMTIKAELAF